MFISRQKEMSPTSCKSWDGLLITKEALLTNCSHEMIYWIYAENMVTTNLCFTHLFIDHLKYN